MRSKLKFKPMFFILLSAGLAGIAILTAIILLQREDHGFMIRECIEGQGKQGEIKWAKEDLPVPVYLAESEKELEPDVKQAIEFWAPYLMWGGYQFPLQERRDPAIVIDTRPVTDDREMGHAVPKWNDCRIRRVEITIPMPQMEGRARSCRVKHELGHALGLDHDDDEDLVMKGVRDWRFDCDMSDQDRALLEKTYR